MHSGHAPRKRALVGIWVAILGMLFIGFVGLALDLSLIKLSGQQLQTAADATALAGAARVTSDISMARVIAVKTALHNSVTAEPFNIDPNEVNDPTGDIVVGHYDRFGEPPTFDPFAHPSNINAFKVVARRTEESLDGPIPLVFGPVFGVDSTDVSRSAIAMVGGHASAALLLLCEDCPCSLRVTGSATLSVTTEPGYDGPAAIHVNSDSQYCPSAAVCVNGGNHSIVADEMNIVAEAPEPYCWRHRSEELDINTGVQSMRDPLRNLLPPTRALPLGGIPDKDQEKRGDPYYNPGYYNEGIRLENSKSKAILNPGIYVLNGEGGGVRGLVSNGGWLEARGVLLYILGEGKVDIKGNGTTIITPMTGGPYEGLSVWQASHNNNRAAFEGRGVTTLEGIYYFPSAHVKIGGSGYALGNQMIAYTLELHGSGDFILEDDGSFPAPGGGVFLVH